MSACTNATHDPSVRTTGRLWRPATAVVAVAMSLTLGGCGASPSVEGPSAHTRQPSYWFEDVTDEVGLTFVHRNGGSGRRYMVETIGSGGGLLDFDGDGWLDVYMLQGAPLPGHPAAGGADDELDAFSSRLFRNRGDGTFEDVTAGAGVGEVGYAMGACFGDVDNDGHVDIHVTAFGPDRLLHNRGDGTFEDVTEAAGISNPRWAASCAFADYDGDGCLDLFVANYVDATLDNHIRCGSIDIPQYCHPDVYAGVPDLLYRNRCDGTGSFDEIGAAAGVRIEDPRESKGLGSIWFDADADGDPDLYVANDSTRNFLFRNRGDGTFDEVGVVSGVAFNEHGRTEAGMGLTAGDLDGDARVDLVVTNLDFETNTFYRNLGEGLFEDATATSGLAGPSITKVGFGITAFDADYDGDLDLFVANGHILDNIALMNPTLSFAQTDQLFANDGRGRFTELGEGVAGSWISTPTVSRAVAAGDLDNDGDLDLLVSTCDGPARVLRNLVGQSRGWVALRLLSRHGERDAVGAKVRLVTDDGVRVGEVRAGSSYLSQEDPRLHFGLGDRREIRRLEIRWPEGELQVVPGDQVPPGRLTVIRQPAAAPP